MICAQVNRNFHFDLAIFGPVAFTIAFTMDLCSKSSLFSLTLFYVAVGARHFS